MTSSPPDESTTPPEETTAAPGSWLALLAEFGLVIGFTYSNDVVEFVLDLAGKPYFPIGQWMVLSFDLALVLGTGALKWYLQDEHADFAAFARRLIRGWWGKGAAVVVALHVTLIANGARLAQTTSGTALVINLLATTAFIAAMAMLLLAVHSGTSGSRGSRTWFLPLVFGTLITQIASAMWEPVIDRGTGCADDISSGYFSSAIEFIALILLAIGVELSYVRRAAAVRDATERAAPVLTIILLGAGQLLALSMMVKADQGGSCGFAALWHEYISFLVTTQAMAVGLATITWLLVTDAGQEVIWKPAKENRPAGGSGVAGAGSGVAREEPAKQPPADTEVVDNADQ